jgi:hypothetical protein
MSATFLARTIVTAIAAGQGIAPLFLDLNRTHVTNPRWPGHARFHTVQQTFTLLPAALVEMALIWWPGSELPQRFYFAAALAATPLAGFIVAMLARPLYGGTLHDPNGIQPLRLRTRRGQIEIDINVPIVLVAAGMLAVAVILFRLS